MHMTLLVVGNGNILDMMEPFWQDLEVPRYLVGLVSEEDKERCLSYYKEVRGQEFNSFDECYKVFGQDWNSGHYEKDWQGVWKEYSTSNPNMQWDWFEIGGRWPGRLQLKEGRRPLRDISFSYGYSGEDKKKFIDEHPNCCDVAYKGDVANLDTLTSYSILIGGEWIELDGARVAPYLENVSDDTILTCIDYHM